MNNFVAGASASINKTRHEIERIVAGQKLSPGGPLRRQLRGELQDSLAALAKLWYLKGVNRGHKEAYLAYKNNGKVPVAIAAEVVREFVPNAPKRVRLKSTLSRKFRANIRNRVRGRVA